VYINSVEIENVGPVDLFKYQIERSENGAIKPLILLGKNGAGKSIVLSHFVNPVMEAFSAVYDDAEMERGKVYKLRSPNFIKRGKSFSRSRVTFDQGFLQEEIQLHSSKEDFEATYKYTPADKIWTQIAEGEATHYNSNFQNKHKELRAQLDKFSFLFFPPNRFEEPDWLNENNLKNKVEYYRTSGFQNNSDRKVISHSPLKENESWLLDLIYDANALENQLVQVPSITGNAPAARMVRNGPASRKLEIVTAVLQKLLRFDGQLQYIVGRRSQRRISLGDGQQTIVTNLFGLSTGQTAVLNIFLSILRSADLLTVEHANLDELQGTVVVDEIDSHLHSDMQYEILPEILSMFPKIQFVLTSHSPLFLLGMQNKFGNHGITLVDLPSGERTSAEKFSEFEAAYLIFSSSQKFLSDIHDKIVASKMPLLICEGSTDEDYIKKAAEHLGKIDLMGGFQLSNAEGTGGLAKIFKNFDTPVSKVLPQKVILLFDCDAKNENKEKGNVFLRKIPRQDNPLDSGIENLFSKKTIDKLHKAAPKFFDIVPEHNSEIRGIKTVVPEKWQINSQEKRNVCDWLLVNGDAEDFDGFREIFEAIEKI